LILITIAFTILAAVKRSKNKKRLAIENEAKTRNQTFLRALNNEGNQEVGGSSDKPSSLKDAN